MTNILLIFKLFFPDFTTTVLTFQSIKLRFTPHLKYLKNARHDPYGITDLISITKKKRRDICHIKLTFIYLLPFMLLSICYIRLLTIFFFMKTIFFIWYIFSILFIYKFYSHINRYLKLVTVFIFLSFKNRATMLSQICKSHYKNSIFLNYIRYFLFTSSLQVFNF